MRLFARVGIMLISSSLLLSGCSDQHDLTLNSPAQHNTRPRLLDPRTNPMETYIQSNWTSSDPSATGGLHFDNIKIYGHHYGDNPSQTDASFIASHFDVYMGGGESVRDAAANTSVLWLGEAANIPHVRNGWDSLQVNTFLANANPNNYEFDDLLLHYQVNTSTYVVSLTPGWNPADDGNGDGCIDGSPSDPNRSASCIWNARVRNYVPARWRMANVAGQAYIDFRAWYSDDLWDNMGVEGFHFDEASYENQNVHMENTIEYYGQSVTSPSFDYIADKYAFVPSVMSQVESNQGGNPIVAFSNAVNSDYICNTSNSNSYYYPQHDLAQDNLENILLETWMPNLGYADTSKRDRMLECPFTDFLEQGKGVVFTYREDSAQGRLFSLCMFYMINHQMAFYYYTKQGHSGASASTGQWNPWVVYNVGQPMVNDLGLSDFQSNSNTDRFFVFASGANYQVLGREYYRADDEATILVLAKLMAPGQTAGANSTPIALGDTYRKVTSSFNLGQNITQISLVNNEGVILVRGAGEGGGGGCHCEMGN